MGQAELVHRTVHRPTIVAEMGMHEVRPHGAENPVEVEESFQLAEQEGGPVQEVSRRPVPLQTMDVRQVELFQVLDASAT